MKKRFKILILSLVAIMAASALVACDPQVGKPKYQYKQFILSRPDCISEMKMFAKRDEVFFFDCDFSNFDALNITQTSYNISVNGYFLSDEASAHQYLDPDKAIDIAFVANYKVEGSAYIYGFSIISRILEPKKTYNNNNENQYTTDNIFYDENSFTSVNELGDNGTSNGGNGGAVAVPDGFLPSNYLQNGTYYEYLKLKGNLMTGLTILAQPVEIVTWNKAFDPDKATIHQIIDYFNAHATYQKY